MARVELQVEGLREVARALKGLDGDVRRELPRELKKVAVIVADDAQNRVPVDSGAARKSIRARATAQQAAVVGGKKTVPYYGWLDFGSRTPVKGQGRWQGPWQNSGRGPSRGRFIYPAIDANWRRIVKAAGDAVDNARRKAGF